MIGRKAVSKRIPTLTLEITKDDVTSAVCGNRRQCVIAHAIDRQLKLGGLGYISVDANKTAYTHAGYRHQCHPPKSALDLLRRFDEEGQRNGLHAARDMTLHELENHPIQFKLIEIRRSKISPPASRERKDQINRRRNGIAAEDRAQGIVRPAKRKRYTGV
jgi:hypothetical protein